MSKPANKEVSKLWLRQSQNLINSVEAVVLLQDQHDGTLTPVIFRPAHPYVIKNSADMFDLNLFYYYYNAEMDIR